MKLFGKKENKNKNENKGMGNDIINQLALQEALRELKTEKKITNELRLDLQIFDRENEELKQKINSIKEICKQSKTSKIAKAILKELGE